MPARIVVVTDDIILAGDTVAALLRAGHDALAIFDPMSALAALEKAETVDLLITSSEFGPNQPNGLSLARMARLKRPGIKAIIVGDGDLGWLEDDHFTFLSMPTTADRIAELTHRVLTPGRRTSD